MNAAQVRKFRRKFLRDNKVALVTARLVNDQDTIQAAYQRVPRAVRPRAMYWIDDIPDPILPPFYRYVK